MDERRAAKEKALVHKNDEGNKETKTEDQGDKGKKKGN